MSSHLCGCFSRVVGCSGQYWHSSSSLDFGLCQELHPLGLGQSLVVFDVVFSVVGFPSIVSACLGFQDLIFGDLTFMLPFIARGGFHGLLILFCLSPSFYVLSSHCSFHYCSHLWWLSLLICFLIQVWIVISYVYAVLA